LSPLLSLIIPALNEEKRIPGSLTKIFQFLSAQNFEAEIIVVDNGSSDRTAEVVSEFSRDHENLRLYQEEIAGKGLAVRRGMLESSAEFRFICDADLAMPIEEVLRFLPPHKTDYDIAIASREAPGAVRYNEPQYRHIIGRVFNHIVRIMAVPGFMDTQCGFKCFRGEIAEKLFRIQRLDGWTFDVEVLFLANQWGLKIIEIPINWYYFPGSRVRVVRDSINMFLDLFRIRLNWTKGLYDSPFKEQ
jgi:dolichyl-phosphate beta-glucosyltransferase